jgi:hypothetical protein
MAIKITMIKFKVLFCILFFLLQISIFAQDEKSKSDSLEITISTGALVSTNDKLLPFYLVNNQFGEVDPKGNFFLSGQLLYEKDLVKNFKFTSGFGFRNDIFSKYYLSLSFKDWHLETGRIQQTSGGFDSGLSSGSLALSENALPVPMVSLSLKEYKPIPFTHGYLKYKGSFSHRWLEEDRYISNAQLHGKSFYAMLDLEEVIGLQVSSGIVHFAQYGGVSPQGDRQPSDFADFLRVFMGAGIVDPDDIGRGEGNGLGNHLGITEFTFKKIIGKHTLSYNYQKQFEDEGSIQYISLKDFLMSLEWDLGNKEGLVTKVHLEWLESKWQSGRGFPDPTETVQTVEDNMGNEFGERDDYYNNYLYRSGWTYNERVMGNPLFLTYKYTLNFLNPYPDYGVAIANNRISAVHLGLEGKLSDKITYKGLFTYSKNFGTYAGVYEGRFNWAGITTDPKFDYAFLPALSQFYSAIQLQWKNPFNKEGLSFETKLAFDKGELYDALGIQLSVSYSLLNH